LNLSPLVSTVVLTVVLFDAGLRLDIFKSLRLLPISTLLAIVNFILSAAITTVIMMFLGYSFIVSLLFGFIIGGTSVAVIPVISRQIKMKQKTRMIVTLEATLTDPLGIVLTLAIISIITLSYFSVVSAVSTILSSFSIGIVLGAVLGLAWIPIMSYLQDKQYEFSYIASLSLVFIIYILVQYFGGSGPLSALTFGVIIANGEMIYKTLRYRHHRSFTLSQESKDFNYLITFIVSSFFFVYLGGLIVLSDWYDFIIGMGISVALVLIRLLGTRLTFIKSRIASSDIHDIQSMVSRGLGAAVLSTLPLEYGIAHAQNLINITFAIIFTTIFINSVLLLYYGQNHKKKNKS
ncbi:MAG: cation:proton antiporter, partial [Nanoarchaeota archaeon]|nr:cation:proton antiporter [Nanoarchaeota archaeon]